MWLIFFFVCVCAAGAGASVGVSVGMVAVVLSILFTTVFVGHLSMVHGTSHVVVSEGPVVLFESLSSIVNVFFVHARVRFRKALGGCVLGSWFLALGFLILGVSPVVLSLSRILLERWTLNGPERFISEVDYRIELEMRNHAWLAL